MQNQLTVFDILNTLSIPQNYKVGLAESYYKVILAAVLEKFPLTEQEIEKAVEEKQEVIELISKKYPSLLENQQLLSRIKEINSAFIGLLLSLADEQTGKAISDLAANIA